MTIETIRHGHEQARYWAREGISALMGVHVEVGLGYVDRALLLEPGNEVWRVARDGMVRLAEDIAGLQRIITDECLA